MKNRGGAVRLQCLFTFISDDFLLHYSGQEPRPRFTMRINMSVDDVDSILIFFGHASRLGMPINPIGTSHHTVVVVLFLQKTTCRNSSILYATFNLSTFNIVTPQFSFSAHFFSFFF